MKTNRSQPNIPTDLAARKAEIDWLYDHKVWAIPIPAHEDVEDEVLDLIGGTLQDGTRVIYDVRWSQCVEIRPAYVNPENRTVEDDEALNTHFEIWIEGGPMVDISDDDDGFPEPEKGWDEENKWMGSHDYRLDCGGDDLETALLTFASLVRLFYKEDGTCVEIWPCDWVDEKSTCKTGGDGFCGTCGFAMEEEGVKITE